MTNRCKFGFLLAALTMAATAWASDLAILRNGFSIRYERREVIDSTTRLYTSGDAGSYVDVPTTAIERFEKEQIAPRIAPPLPSQGVSDFVNSASAHYRLDPDLVNSVIHAESGFNPHAVSHKGAQGLMQLMPQTASQLGVSNVFDPQSNVEGGTRYLRELLERYNFDLVKALAAYNAGPRRVQQYRGVPPYYETRAYVASIIRDFNRKKRAQQRISAASKSKAVTSQPQLASTKKHSEISASDIEPLPGSH